MTETTPQLALTEDGSPTLFAPTVGEHYHSTHGALQESLHIFIRLGLRHRCEAGVKPERPLRLFEVGLGTGLNTLLTATEAERLSVPIHYYSVERYPLTPEVYGQLAFAGLDTSLLQAIHTAPWGEDVPLTPYFTLHKLQGDLTELRLPHTLDLIYFDAFSPESQPELWEEGIFQSLFDATEAGAVLTTYCAKGVVRRRLQAVGFFVERLPGPPGKREVLRATHLHPQD